MLVYWRVPTFIRLYFVKSIFWSPFIAGGGFHDSWMECNHHLPNCHVGFPCVFFPRGFFLPHAVTVRFGLPQMLRQSVRCRSCGACSKKSHAEYCIYLRCPQGWLETFRLPVEPLPPETNSMFYAPEKWMGLEYDSMSFWDSFAYVQGRHDMLVSGRVRPVIPSQVGFGDRFFEGQMA